MFGNWPESIDTLGKMLAQTDKLSELSVMPALRPNYIALRRLFNPVQSVK